jgi:hypothetical protein
MLIRTTFEGEVMFHFRRDRRPRERARHHLNRLLRARALVEELEPRTLLAAAPLAVVLMPSPALSSRVGPARVPVQSPTPVAAQAASTLNGGQVTLPLTTGGVPSGAVPAAAGTASVALSQPLATTLVVVLTNQGAILGVFTSLPPDTNQAGQGATPAAPQAGTEVLVERIVISVQRLSGNVPLPITALLLAQAPPTAPPATNPTTTAVVNVPPSFNPATHRLLFVVGGPEDRSTEDYLDEYEDGRVFPSPERPPLPVLDTPRREATVSVEEARAVEPAWPWACERYFAGEFAVDEAGAEQAPALGTAEGAGAYALGLEDKENPTTAPELLAAVAAFGLLNGTRWQKEGTRDGEEPRRRPAILADGTV